MIVLDEQGMQELREAIFQSEVVCLDFETNVTDSWNDRFPVGFAVSTDKGEFYVPVGHRCDIRSLGPNYELPIDPKLFDAARVVCSHNSKFDLQMAERVGLIIDPEQVYCTMLMSHYIDENQSHRLDDLGKKYFNVGKTGADFIWDISKISGGHERIPTMGMAVYAEQDAKLGRDLFTRLEPEFRQYDELWKTTDRPFLFLLSDIEKKGILIDSAKAKEAALTTAIRMGNIQAELGFDPARSSEVHRRLFGIPPEGLGLIPTKVSPKTGKPTTDSAYLKTVNHPIAGLILEYRQCQKALSSYFDPYQRFAGASNRIHPNFKQHGTTTGRMSCENPNLQQIPKEEKNSLIKKLFLPEEGCELWEFDFRTIEYRVMALYSEIEELIQIFRDERDFHTEIAKELNITRQQAKMVNYLVGYGGGAKTLADRLGYGYTTRHAEGFLNSYRARYPALFEKMYEAETIADVHGKITLWTGRDRHFKYTSEHRKAFNSLCQGGAFEVVKRSMLKLQEAGYDMRNQVHDSVWINIPRSEVQNAQIEIPRIMSDWTEEEFGLRFSVDAGKLN